MREEAINRGVLARLELSAARRHCRDDHVCGAVPEGAKGRSSMLKSRVFPIASIYVPVKRRATLDAKKVQTIAEAIMEHGLQAPILVRQDGERFVLVEGLHRLEACRSLGEETILGYLVEARRH